MMPVKKSQNWLPGIFNDFFGNEWIEKANSASPAINIIESDTDYKVELAAPGMTKDDFSVKIDADNQLVVSMEKKEEHKDEDKKGRYLRREFSYSRFQQVMILPENVEKDKIDAKVQNGVLTIDIPKKQEAVEAKKVKESPSNSGRRFPCIRKRRKFPCGKFSPLSRFQPEKSRGRDGSAAGRAICAGRSRGKRRSARKKIGRRRNNVLHFRILIINFAKRRCAFEWGRELPRKN